MVDQSHPLRVLVVDDSPIDRRLIGGLLNGQTDWSVSYAIDGGDAIGQLSESEFDVVVTDIQMPGINGLELVKHLRDSIPRLPVILVTSQGSEEIAVEALRSGAASYSPKSDLSRDLVVTIGRVTGMRSDDEIRSLTDLEEFTVVFSLENDTSLIGPVIDQLQRHLPGWARPDEIRLGMALNEALVNAMHHGNLEADARLRQDDESKYIEVINERRDQAPFQDRRVKLQADFSPNSVTFTITDEGSGFDPHTVVDSTVGESLSRLGGRGLLLINTFMDEVHHNKQGNQIKLVKRPGS